MPVVIPVYKFGAPLMGLVVARHRPAVRVHALDLDQVKNERQKVRPSSSRQFNSMIDRMEERGSDRRVDIGRSVCALVLHQCTLVWLRKVHC